MKKGAIISSLLVIVIVGTYYLLVNENVPKKETVADLKPESVIIDESLREPQAETVGKSEPAPAIANPTQAAFISPLDRAEERIRLKMFGDYITPETSPVSPERFSGYHTGVDLEIFAAELNSVVTVKAGCSGKIVEKRWVSGYGGVVVTECELEALSVTVVYGHLNLGSITAKAGDRIEAGAILGRLGANHSPETDNERKHLHLGIYKGKTVNLRGYVNREAELKAWLDPCDYICS